MWHDTLVDGSVFREWIANVGRRDARTRLAHLLCEFALRLEAAGLGEHSKWELPMTQEQLADATGLTPVHVNRTLKTLDADGLIVRNKRAVSVSDWKRLAAAGDFQSGYLHMRDDKLALVQ
jgi:CRP-like cAMP-binding protein